MPGIKQLRGKDFTIKLDGKTRKIGEITHAVITPDRGALIIDVILRDEEIAGILGAAQDKTEAAESPIGMSDAEIKAALDESYADGAVPGPGETEDSKAARARREALDRGYYV